MRRPRTCENQYVGRPGLHHLPSLQGEVTAMTTIQDFAQRVQARVRLADIALVAVLDVNARCRLPNGLGDYGVYEVTVKPGPKYTRIDVGSSGRFMVVNDTGEIYGIKAYGVIHRGHYFGTLDTPSPSAFQR